MRAITLALVLMACGSDDDPHDVGSCDPNWGPVWDPDNGTLPETCERACRSAPPIDGGRCPAYEALAGDQCALFAEVNGVLGCCTDVGAPNSIIWLECE